MAKIVLHTQVYENYAFDEQGRLGTGDKAYWKAKGGCDYVVKNIDMDLANDIIVAATAQIEQDNDMFRETVIFAEVVEDNYLTEFEQDQLNYDGRIQYPAHEITV